MKTSTTADAARIAALALFGIKDYFPEGETLPELYPDYTWFRAAARWGEAADFSRR
jgi:hypothetical protein